MGLLCAYCKKPLELIHSIESEKSGFVHEETEYMCTNPRCDQTTRVLHRSSRPLQKNGYITLSMIHRKDSPKRWLRKFFRDTMGQSVTN